MNLIFKIAGAAEWRAAEAAGVFAGAAVDRADGYIHFSTATQAAETAAKWFAGRDDLMLAAVDADALGAGSALGALARRRAVSASLCALAAVGGALGARRCRSAPTGVTIFGNLDRMMRALGALALPFLQRLEPETAHRAAIAALRMAPTARAALRSAPERRGLRPRPSQSARDGGGLRQERRSSARPARRRLRLCRGRHADAAPASRQSAPAPVSPGARRGADQSAGLQQ